MKTSIRRAIAGIMTLMTGLALMTGSVAARSDNGKNAGHEGETKISGQNASSNALSVRIGTNGKISARSATVTGISGTTVSAKSAWGGATFQWSVQAADPIRVRTRGNGRIGAADMKIGDLIDFDGTLTGGSGPFAVKADEITDLSVQMPAKTTVEGKLKSVASTTVPTELAIVSGGTEHTVRVAADTMLLTAGWMRTSISRFSIGDTVRAYGSVHDATVDAVAVRDASLLLP